MNMKLLIAVTLATATLVAAYPTPEAEFNEHDKIRQQVVDEINSLKGILWKAHISPRFKGLPIGASKSLCGVLPGSKARLDAEVASGNFERVTNTSLQGIQLPESFDSAENWPQCAKVINDIRDQSNCGCCWAFGGAEAASDRLCIATNASTALPLSAQNLCFCASDSGCDGGFLSESWNYIKKKGLVTGTQQTYTQDGGDPDPFAGTGLCSKFSLPHCHHHGPKGQDPFPAENAPGCPATKKSPKCPTACDSDAKAPHNSFAKDKYSFTGKVTTYDSDADTIAKAIMTNGPVEAAFTVYDDFENYAGGIYHATSKKMAGGHAIRIVGWGVEGGVKYWKVANSWNPYWGENGYFRIKRGNNECGIEEQATSNSADSTWTTPGSGPSPAPPTPTPPTPPSPPSPPSPGPSKNCFNIKSEQQCKAAGSKCTWCAYTKPSPYGFCDMTTVPCPKQSPYAGH